jgi:putative ABC transport system permease protein
MNAITALLADPFGMGGVLALRNLVHDRIRLMVTLVGIVFAVALMNVEIAIFLGFARTTSSLVDHAGADLWVMAEGTRNVDQAVAIPEQDYYQALATPGVAQAAKLNVEFAELRRPDGGSESVLVVGLDPNNLLIRPWDVVKGDIRSLRYPNTIMIDEFYRDKLGISRLGQAVEIAGHRAQVVGFTRGIRSFTQSPYVFASTRTALDYSRIRSDQTKYVLVKLKPGADPAAVTARLHAVMPDTEILSAGAFGNRTQVYWMFTTGAGLALLVAAFMGLAVGAVVISQTLYATTIDHIAEFGTLRAIGATNHYLHAVIIRQALMSGVWGYVVGLAISLGAVNTAQDGGPAMILPISVILIMFLVTMLMCVGAAVISINRVTRIDPSAVFK